MSFNIALTGISAASTDLSTISNNIANNATTGFKRSRAEFADVYAESTFSSASSTTGQGVRVTDIRQEHNQGDLQMTDRNLDLAVEGLGMFRMDDNGTALYTRSGNFSLDREGFIVDNQGNNLTGFGVDANAEILPIIGDLQIDYSDLPTSQSSRIDLIANLDSDAEVPGETYDPVTGDAVTDSATAFNVTDPASYNFQASTLVYDSLGSPEVANTYFQKNNGTDWTAFTYVGDQYVSVAGATGADNGTEPKGVKLVFGTTGTLDNSLSDTTDDGTFITEAYDPASGSAAPMALTFNFGKVATSNNEFGVNSISQDGFAAGRLEDFDIASDGVIYGRYTNGESQAMGQVVLSNFTNESGLRQIGNTNWTETYASGAPATGAPGSASLGNLQSGTLEGSNVDITQELVSMITAQRSFQANAKVISTGDTLTQTVINLGR